jgi:aspartate racemase
MAAKIGVLGGIGPEATGTYYLKLIAELQRRGYIDENGDFPQIIINSIPAPELVFEEIGDGDLEWYARGLRELDAAEPDFLLMVCNTIHLFFDEMKAAVRAPLIDLREALRAHLAGAGYTDIAILGTPETVTQGLYQFEEFRYHNPTADELAVLSEAIFRFNRNIERERQIETSLGIARRLLDDGAQAAVLACTEFAVMLGESDIPRVNTIDVLVDATIARLHPEAVS